MGATHLLTYVVWEEKSGFNFHIIYY